MKLTVKSTFFVLSDDVKALKKGKRVSGGLHPPFLFPLQGKSNGRMLPGCNGDVLIQWLMVIIFYVSICICVFICFWWGFHGVLMTERQINNNSVENIFSGPSPECVITTA